METPPAEELLKKIQELEVGHARLKQEMSRLMPPASTVSATATAEERRRAHSVSPKRTAPSPVRRRSGGYDVGGGGRRAMGPSGSFGGNSSRLQRESKGTPAAEAERCGDGGEGLRLSDRQYLNILQSMGQAVHIFDLDGRIIYW